MQKSFLMYVDYDEKIFSNLDATQTGLIVKEMFKLQQAMNENKEYDPELESPLLKIVFNQISTNMKRDHEKWMKRAIRNKQNGQKGGRPKRRDNESQSSET